MVFPSGGLSVADATAPALPEAVLQPPALLPCVLWPQVFLFSFIDHLSWPRVLLFVFHWQFILTAGAFVFCFADLSYRPQLLLFLFLEHVLLVACALVFVSLKPIYSWSHELRNHATASLLKSFSLI